MPRLIQGTVELLDFGVPAHETGEPAGGGGLESRSRGADPDELVDLDGGGQPLHRHWPQGRDVHETLGERKSVGGQEARSGIGQLLHPRREMGGLAHRGVVHAEVGANGPDNHLARVQADADTDGDPLLASYPLGVLLTRSCIRSAA